MNRIPTPSKSAFWLTLSLVLLAVLLGAVHESGNARTLFYPHGFKANSEEWADHSAEHWVGSHGGLYFQSWRDQPILVPAVKNGAPYHLPVKYSRGLDGPLSVIVYLQSSIVAPTELTILRNGVEVARVHSQAYGSAFDPRVVELEIPAAIPEHDLPFLEIRSEGGSWFGSIMLMPNPGLRKFLSLAILPLTISVMVLAVLLLHDRPRILVGIVGIAGFCLFYYHGVPARNLPANPYFSDSQEIIDSVRHNSWNADMQKHPAFLPVMSVLSQVLGLVTSKTLKVISVAICLISAVNLGLVALCIRRLATSRWLKAGLLAVYTSAFATLTYASIIETYMLTTLFTSLALLGCLRVHQTPDPRSAGWAALSFGLLPLGSWQLALMIPALVFWLAWSLRRCGGKWIRDGLKLGGISVATVLLTFLALDSFYKRTSPQQNAEVADVLQNTHEQHASFDNLTAPLLLESSKDTFLNALVNPDQLMTMPQGETIPWVSFLTFLIIITLSLSALWFMVRQPLQWQFPVWTGLATVAGYLLFHCYFNQREMLLYQSPILLFWLLPLVLFASRALGTRLTCGIILALLALQIGTQVHVEHRFKSHLFQAPGLETDIQLIDWEVR